MNAASGKIGARPLIRQGVHVPLAREFVTVAISTAALIVLCFIFARSSVTYGSLAGSLPFAAVLAIVGLGQMLVVQQGGFDLSVAGGVSLAVVISTHYPGRQQRRPSAGAVVGDCAARWRSVWQTARWSAYCD